VIKLKLRIEELAKQISKLNSEEKKALEKRLEELENKKKSNGYQIKNDGNMIIKD
jgi:hypothetical protein